MRPRLFCPIPWRILIPIVFLTLMCAVPASAGRNANGALIVHTNDAVTYTGTADYCATSFLPTSCEEAITRTDKDESTPAVIWLLAAFPDTSSPAVTAIQFGIDHNLPANEGYFERYGKCGELEMPDQGWPETGFGNLVSFGSTAKTEPLFPFYWFAAYGFEGAYLGTRTYPSTDEAKFVDDSPLPVEDVIDRFGVARWYSAGQNTCPPMADDYPTGNGASDPPGDSEQQEDQLDGFPSEVEFVPSNEVALYLEPSVSMPIECARGPVDVQSALFDSTTVGELLRSTGAETIKRTYPLWRAADTVRTDLQGNMVHLIDLTRFFRVAFPDTGSARASLQQLNAGAGVRMASIVPQESGSVTTTPDDRYYDEINTWFLIDHDAQWHLNNDGGRFRHDGPPAQCDSSLAGYDIHAEDAWARVGFGDENTVIGIADLGVLGGGPQADSTHEDLGVIPIDDDSLRATIQIHPFDNWCGDHGTRMAGLAAAKTNNAKGVAGVCGNCPILDVEIASHTCNCALTHCGAPDRLYFEKVANASIFPLTSPKKLVAMNMSFHMGFGSGSLANWDVVAGLWNAYNLGVALVASSGDYTYSQPLTCQPANIPFVLGVGGSTWEGRFWDAPSTCYDDSTKGTTVGYAELPTHGGALVDICAPATDLMATTEPLAHWQNPTVGEYWLTSGQCSGAAAQVSGTVGLVQSAARSQASGLLSVDDVLGIIQCTVDPFTIDPTSEPGRACGTCPRDYYGWGILNADDATGLATVGYPWWRDCEQVVRKSNALAWSFQVVDSFDVGSVRWLQYRVSAGVHLDLLIPPSGRGTDRIGWVRRLSPNTTTFSAYGNKDTRVMLAQLGIHDCRLASVDNPSTGLREISGYTYAYRDAGGSLHFLVDEDHIQMAYVVICNYQSSVEGAAEPGREELQLSIAGRTGEPRAVRWTQPVPGDARVGVVDVSGRRLASKVVPRLAAGRHELTWAEVSGGDRYASGVYWVTLKVGASQEVRKCVVLR
jgi:hypothetical protein